MDAGTITAIIGSVGMTAVMIFVFGEDTIRAIFSSRHRNRLASLKGQVKAKDAEIARLNELVTATSSGLRALSQTPHEVTPGELTELTQQIQALVQQSHNDVLHQAAMRELLGQVQAADQVYPQLGLDLRRKIDQLLDASQPALPAAPEPQRSRLRRDNRRS